MTHSGIDHFFAGDQEYHYMTLRVMGDIPAGGAEAGEVLSIISRIPEGDGEQWFSEWNNGAVRVEKMGSSLENRMSRGYALLRAHSYYRTAEYFLSPSDPRRLPTFRKKPGHVRKEPIAMTKKFSDQHRHAEGERVRAEVLGPSYAGIGKKDDPFYRHFYDFTIDHCWGNVWLRPGLDRKTRSMLNLALLTAMGRWAELEIHTLGRSQ